MFALADISVFFDVDFFILKPFPTQ